MDTKALRQKILDLAIRGKLVPQDPNDEPASVLLERIREQKQQMVKDGKLKKKDIKNDSVIFVGEDNLHYEKLADGSVKCIEEEIPFEVPEGWAWARLKHICMMAAGKSKPSDQIKTEPFVGSYPCFGGNGIRGYLDEYNQDGTFSIVGRQGALCGNINIASGKFYATEHAVVTTLFYGIDFNWSNYTLEALQLNQYATGAAQPGLSVANILNVFVPVPPTREQECIGNKIAESIKIIEIIANDREDLQTLISTIKSKILDLAIRGQLVPQNPDDEPASVLLERIRAEKEELIKQGKIKRDKKESIIFKGEDNSYYEIIENEVKIIDNSLLFDIPDNWCWCRIRSIANVKGGKRLPKGGNFSEFPTAHAYIRVTDMKNQTVNTGDLKYISDDVYEQIKSYTISTDDIYITIAGTIGVVGEIPEELDNMNLTENAVKVCDIKISKKYLSYVLQSQFVQNQFQDKTHQVAMPKLALERILTTSIPIPPYKEQLRLIKIIGDILGKLNIIDNSVC